ncbi:DUF2490 domain-containing protein [uncultured Winogradskyella sp.]|uniref:DUF2490 domain-containing protein n=1 Tax=uncultured Winogradskyella sp. TaxID=395353 RepID=UPI0030DC6D6F|tara:strand:- start:9292 stop:9984 length:693 start_codon:yes stop_codon:yes gene_type:complete
MKRFIFLLALILYQVSLFAQNPSEDFLGSWYTYGINHRINEHFSLTPYAELRFYELATNYNLAFISLRGNYHLSSNSTLGLGYAFLDIDTAFEFDNAPNIKENRIYEQYIFKHRFGKLKMQHRGRLEQRFFNFTDRNELQQRFRYRISFRYDINKALYLMITEEPFVNFQDQVFHENRFYTGIGFNVLKHSQIQIGYLKQNIRKNNLNRIQVGISIQTDSRKPKTALTQL